MASVIRLGWMMGPWSIFAAFINGASLALYTGNPNGKSFGAFVQDARVNILGVVPTLVKHWREQACMESFDWSEIKAFTSTGECSNPEDMLYLMFLAGYRPIIEYCGGTEIGGGYITGTTVQPCAPGAFTTAAMGLDFSIIDENGSIKHYDSANAFCEKDIQSEHQSEQTAQKVTKGEIALLPPSIGLSTTLLNKDHHQIYYEGMPLGLRRHGDEAEYYSNGYYRLLGRVDDTMNLSGIKISSEEIERILNTHPKVLETAAVALKVQDNGPEQLVIFAVLKEHKKSDKVEKAEAPEDLKKELQSLIKEKLNPLFKIEKINILQYLPRTASNKIMRRALRAWMNNGNVTP